VDILATEADTIALKGGLAAGERVVVDGQDKLRPGSKVATPEAGGKGKP